MGVIGLSTVETPSKTSGFVEGIFPSTYTFLSYKDVVMEEAKALREKGAHAIIVVGHVGNDCGMNTDYGVWTEKSMGNISNCDQTD